MIRLAKKESDHWSRARSALFLANHSIEVPSAIRKHWKPVVIPFGIVPKKLKASQGMLKRHQIIARKEVKIIEERSLVNVRSIPPAIEMD